MADIVRLVEKDVSITAAVLKVANSGLYGWSQRIVSIQAAIRVLGIDLFSQTVFRKSVKEYIGSAMPSGQLSSCWSHCRACAEICKMLAPRVGLPSDIAYSSGLLHDIGRFALTIAMPVEYSKLAETCGYVEVLDAEDRLFGCTHTEIGRLVAEQFNLPNEIQIAAGRHHDRLDGAEVDNLAIVSCSCAIATAIGYKSIPCASQPSFESMLNSFPAPLRDHVEPDVGFWKTNVLKALDAP